MIAATVGMLVRRSKPYQKWLSSPRRSAVPGVWACDRPSAGSVRTAPTSAGAAGLALAPPADRAGHRDRVRLVGSAWVINTQWMLALVAEINGFRRWL